jgi:hypothetical protein
MRLLKAYVHEVVSYHPPADRDELFAEIYDEICEEYADQRKTNADLSEADFLNTSKQHPMKYATQLAGGSASYLVGPQFYFSFLSALKTGVSLTAAIFLTLAVIAALGSDHQWRTFYGVLFQLPGTLLWVSAVILGVFVAMEKAGEKASWLDNWKASDLKIVDSHQSVSRGEAFFDLSVSTIGLLWIFDIIQLPQGIDQGHPWYGDWLVLVPDWCWVAMATLFVFEIGFSLLRMTRRLWTSRLRLTKILTNILWVALLGFIALQPQLLDVTGPVTETITDVKPVIDRALKLGLAVVVAIVLWDTAIHTWRLLKPAPSDD